jgi:hypothetical protein
MCLILIQIKSSPFITNYLNLCNIKFGIRDSNQKKTTYLINALNNREQSRITFDRRREGTSENSILFREYIPEHVEIKINFCWSHHNTSLSKGLFHKLQYEHKSTYVRTVSSVIQLWITMPLTRKDKSTLPGPIKSCVSALNDLNLLCRYMQIVVIRVDIGAIARG